ncbi:hypothetical protein ACFY8K_12955 [Streptomyces misionensis]
MRDDMGLADPHPAVGRFAPEPELVTATEKAGSPYSPGTPVRCCST